MAKRVKVLQRSADVSPVGCARDQGDLWAVDEVPLRRRVARLSFLAVALFALAVSVFVLAGWVAHRVAPKDIVGQLPLGPYDLPGVSLLVAAGAAAAAFFVGLAALHAAAAMRRAGSGPADPAAALAGAAPGARPDARSARTRARSAGRGARASAEQAARPRPARRRLRLTVLVPAHDEALTIAGHAGVVCGARRGRRTGSWSSPTTAPTTPPRSRARTERRSSPPSATRRRRPVR